MKLNKISIIFILSVISFSAYTQTYVKGKVVDLENRPLMYALVKFKGTNIKTVTDFDGNFMIKDIAKKHSFLEVSSIGYSTKIVEILKHNIKIVLEEGEALKEVILYTKDQPKENNPAVEILRNIWNRRKKNSLDLVDQYNYEEYEKIEFDLNNIDSSFMKNKIFKGFEFVFKNVNISKLNGKTYLPIYINEAYYKVYGDNILDKEVEKLIGNKSVGIEASENITEYIGQLYTEYDIYDNFINILNQNFMSPISKYGLNAYNYVLRDSVFLEGKKYYDIVFYPRRKNELTFDGSLLVSDKTFFVKSISLKISKGANINFVRDIKLEQEYKNINDSLYVLERDYIESDFSILENENAKGIYGKRTTLYTNYKFNESKESSFYVEKSDIYDEKVYNRDSIFWINHRLEKLNEDEKKIYKLVDTIMTIPKFRKVYRGTNAIASGYWDMPEYKFSFGPFLNTIGHNYVEKVRFRIGGRTFKTINDRKRLSGYIAYGTGDKTFKYQIKGQYMFNYNRLILTLDHKYDIDQLGNSFVNSINTSSEDISVSPVISLGRNDKLSWVKSFNFGVQIEPIKNITFESEIDYREIHSASKTFITDYINEKGEIVSENNQLQIKNSLKFTFGRNATGFGISRVNIRKDFYNLYFTYSAGIKTKFIENDLNFHKLGIYFSKIHRLGFIGRLRTSIDIGKILGNVPLILLNSAPANQSLFKRDNTFTNMNFYEFVTDQHIFIDIEDIFSGIIFNKIPFIKKLKLREVLGFRAIWGSLSNKNISINRTNVEFLPLSEKPYMEYSFGITNIFKIFRIDFNFRANYLDRPKARRMKITGKIEIRF